MKYYFKLWNTTLSYLQLLYWYSEASIWREYFRREFFVLYGTWIWYPKQFFHDTHQKQFWSHLEAYVSVLYWNTFSSFWTTHIISSVQQYSRSLPSRPLSYTIIYNSVKRRTHMVKSRTEEREGEREREEREWERESRRHIYIYSQEGEKEGETCTWSNHERKRERDREETYSYLYCIRKSWTQNFNWMKEWMTEYVYTKTLFGLNRRYITIYKFNNL